MRMAGLAEISSLINYYMENAAMLKQTMLDIGLEVHGGTDAPYVFVDLKGKSSWDMFSKILEEAQVSSHHARMQHAHRHGHSHVVSCLAGGDHPRRRFRPRWRGVPAPLRLCAARGLRGGLQASSHCHGTVIGFIDADPAGSPTYIPRLTVDARTCETEIGESSGSAESVVPRFQLYVA